ncbi:hypothetical protein [Variovorax paradoxus]|jgi:hypothetical protein|uniref:hypothetical protein n=1 Tax=Variovorax paradoxus TaxID=34073 RepID=UPI0029C6BF33|nr:hypothetical protein [Variovorax paradoxus]WPH23002.1 hypothetical protein RZE78_12795 [Variovorax paradoxus]
MTRAPGSLGSGDGSRPTTDGGVDNIGAGEKFASSSSAAGEPDSAPAPAEGMARKRKNAEASRHDDSAAFGLREDLRPKTNQEPSKP